MGNDERPSFTIELSFSPRGRTVEEVVERLESDPFYRGVTVEACTEQLQSDES